MFCYLRVAGATQVNSDGAGMVLQASDVLHGNVLLHGWWATDVSFYTTELPEYLAVTAFAGLRPEVVHICSALTYTLLVLLAAFVARGRARGAEGAGPGAARGRGDPRAAADRPDPGTARQPGPRGHRGAGAASSCCCSTGPRAPDRGQQAGAGLRALWWVPVAAGVLLAWSIIGDPLIEVVGAAPLFLACRAAGPAGIARSRRAAAGTGQAERRGRAAAAAPWAGPPPGTSWSLAAAAVAAVPVAAAGNWLIRALGGFNVANAWYHLQSLHEIVHGLPVAARERARAVRRRLQRRARGGERRLRARAPHRRGRRARRLRASRVWGLLRPFARLARPAAARRGGRAAGTPGDLVADILVIAVAANCAAFVLEVPMHDLYVAHEIGPVLSLGAALAGRILGSRISAGGRRRCRVTPRRPPRRQDGAAGPAVLAARAAGAAAALAAGLACYAVMLGIAAAHRQAPPRNVGLTAWLIRTT